MSSLDNISYNDIENKVMLILYTKPNKIFSKSEIFDKLVDNLNLNKTLINR